VLLAQQAAVLLGGEAALRVLDDVVDLAVVGGHVAAARVGAVAVAYLDGPPQCPGEEAPRVSTSAWSTEIVPSGATRLPRAHHPGPGRGQPGRLPLEGDDEVVQLAVGQLVGVDGQQPGDGVGQGLK